MIRIVVENVLLFLLPSAMYIAYVLLTRRSSTAGTVINEAPLVWLFIAGALLVGATLIYYATINPGAPPGAVYTPPRMKDGRPWDRTARTRPSYHWGNAEPITCQWCQDPDAQAPVSTTTLKS